MILKGIVMVYEKRFFSHSSEKGAHVIHLNSNKKKTKRFCIHLHEVYLLLFTSSNIFGVFSFPLLFYQLIFIKDTFFGRCCSLCFIKTPDLYH